MLISLASAAGADSLTAFKRIEKRYNDGDEALPYAFGPTYDRHTKSTFSLFGLAPEIETWLGIERCGLSVHPKALSFKSAAAQYIIPLQGGKPQKC